LSDLIHIMVVRSTTCLRCQLARVLREFSTRSSLRRINTKS